MSIEVGLVVPGTVTGITHFGAFVELPDGKTGLVHISEVANTYVKNINEFLKVSDSVNVKVISIDKDGKIGLSIKQALEPRDMPKKDYRDREKWPNEKRNNDGKLSFEDKLAKFLKESDERQQELKKSLDSKRRGRSGMRKENFF